MERDDDIEKISKELEDMLRMASEKKKDGKINADGRADADERKNGTNPGKDGAISGTDGTNPGTGGEQPSDSLDGLSLTLDLEGVLENDYSEELARAEELERLREDGKKKVTRKTVERKGKQTKTEDTAEKYEDKEALPQKEIPGSGKGFGNGDGDFGKDFPREELSYKGERPECNDPGYDDPKYDDPKYDDPEYDDLEYDDPEYDDPEYDDPEYDDPEYDDPERDNPGHNDSAYNDSRNPSSEDPRPSSHRKKRRADRGSGHESISLIRPSDGLAAAFFVPIILMLIIFAQRGIFPFGEESFLRTDMYHQYAPFFSEFQHKLTTGGSLLYSWDVGMGVNFSALYAYYLASPLNWMIALCPKQYVIEFMTYMIVFKTGLSGLSFAWYLRKHFKTSDFGVAFFAVFYAMSGYMAAYSWNIMWLDCIILFPLIMLGLERLVKEKKCFLYCITLGLSILSNYYISIMICIFMVLYFVAILLMEKRKPLREYAVNFGMFSLFSLLAGGLAAAVLLPEIFALQMTASGNFNFPHDVKQYFVIFDMIARHLPDVETEIGLDHWPNIYCGVAVLMLFLLYLGCRQIRRREKVVYCGMLLFFFISFSINVLNFIWHGLHYPNSLPCRQSFIYIFLMLVICYHAYFHLREIPWKHVVAAFFGAVIFVLMAQKLITDEAYHFSVFYVALLYLSIYVGLIYLYKRGKSRNLLVILTLGIVSIEAAVNMTVTSVTTTSRTSYVRDNASSIALKEEVEDDMGFYRIEKVTRKTKNDGAFMNFPSVSLFSSTANADLSKFFKKLGCESSTNAYSITGSTPLVDALFSVKYGLYSEKPADTGVISPVASEGQMYLYRNDFALPLGVVLPYDFEDNWQLDITNPADVQNDLAAVLGAEPVLEEVPSEILGTSFTFTPAQSGDYYVYVSNKKVEKVSALLGEKTKNFDNINRGYLLELGWLEAGQEITLRNDDNEQDLVAMAYRFRPEGLKSVYDLLTPNSMELTKWTDTEIRGRIDSDRSGLLYFSIPYDAGWTIKVDGREAEPYKIFDTFLSVHLSAGTHEIEMEYMPQGLKPGFAITAGSIAILLIMACVSAKKKNKNGRRRKIKYPPAD